MRALVLSTVIGCLAACAHTSPPPATAMVRVAEPAPPAPRPPVEISSARRRAFRWSGSIVGLVGVGLIGGGVAALETGEARAQEPLEACRLHGDLGCGSSFATAPGIAMIAVGATHVVAGLIMVLQ
jgi:hypothetical protein